MLNKQRLFLSLSLIGLLLSLNTGRLHARVPALVSTQAIASDRFALMGENETFQLYADQTTLAVKVLDKRSGYIWHSNLDEVSDDDRLNRTWTAFATSGISIDYLDLAAGSERASITREEHVIEFTAVDQGFDASLTFTEPSITLVVSVRLEDDGMRVALPFASIVEADPAYKLGMVHLYPFLGATKADSVAGYMFIPDGAGTLIRLAAETKASNMFYGRYYGSDLGMLGSLAYDPTVNRPYQIAIPVIGMAHEAMQSAFIAVIEQGASYGEIQAHPAGVITQFNFLYNAFLYNQSYFQATNRSGAGVTTLQPTTNQFDVLVHYRFLTGDDSDYVGMARSYQRYLVEKGMLNGVTTVGDDIGIRLEFLGAEKEKVLFWNRSIPMTTIEEMRTIVDQLNVPNPDVIYYGWQPRGASSTFPTALRIDSALGSTRELADFAEQIVAANGRFYLYYDAQAALRDEGGYSGRNDLAMSITDVNLLGFNRNKVNYYFNESALTQRFNALSQDVADALPAGLALDGIGTTLYSDYKTNHVLNREGAIRSYQTLLAQSATQTAFYLPNDYVFATMQAYYDIPLTNSGYLYAIETVPFIQIALAGYVPLFGPAMNFSSDLRTDLLRHAEYGIYPSYILTQEVTARILNTRSSWIFSSSYDQWGQEIEETYRWLNNLLSPVKGQPIVGHETLAAGVIATTFGNGLQIVVNYNSTPYTAGDLAVAAQDALIREK